MIKSTDPTIVKVVLLPHLSIISPRNGEIMEYIKNGTVIMVPAVSALNL